MGKCCDTFAGAVRGHDERRVAERARDGWRSS